MSLLYAAKRVVRSWHLFVALLLGIILASAFFAGIDIKANVTAGQALDEQLAQVYKDMEILPYAFNTTQLSTIQEKLSATEGVTQFEVISRAQGQWRATEEMDIFPSVVGVAEDSRVYDGWLNRPAESLAANETYVAQNPNFESGSTNVKVGDVVSINFSVYNPETMSLDIVPLNLTVKGFAQLDDAAYSLVTGSDFYISPSLLSGQSRQKFFSPFATAYFIVDWQKTVEPFLETSGAKPFQQSVIISIDRGSLISAWDIQSSIGNIQVLQNNIRNKLTTALGFSVTVQNNLLNNLQNFQYVSLALRTSFIVISIPIFFMAWYMGTTVSDVSFSSRKREIGLLSIKGFSTGQISRVFLAETILIGVAGSLIGVLLGFFLVPLFTSLPLTQFSLQTLNPYTIVFTAIFGLIMAFLSTFSSSRKAARISAAGALRDSLSSEQESPYRKRLAWLALALGTYKIVIFISGINVQAVLSRAMFAGGNLVLSLIGGVWLVLDTVLNYIGPLLFFWGFAKLFIQGSLKFQELTVRASKFLGDIGTIATKNVRRKPARAAAIAFLIALIIWYSVLVTGQLASEKDYTERQIYASVGADVSAIVANTSEAQAVMDNIVANVSGVKDATVEYSLSPQQSDITLKAVDPQTWLRTAYYENEWFSGATVQDAFNALSEDNDTIILDRAVAASYDLDIGEKLSVEFENGAKSLRVVGFFGPEIEDRTVSGFGFYQSSPLLWSYIPINLTAEAVDLSDASAQILLSIDEGANGTAVAQSVQDLDVDFTYVASVDEALQESQTNVVATGALEVQQLGIIFAVLSASVGTALISAVSMRERSREATIMSVKGLSYKQLVVMFLTENLAVVTFAVLLGLSIGLLSVYGNVSSSNALIAGLVVRHFVFPLDSILLVAGCVALIFAATLLPIIIMARKYVTNLERMVRLR
jgi:ABC-type antimicrobial peptide transport system permease subunit